MYIYKLIILIIIIIHWATVRDGPGQVKRITVLLAENFEILIRSKLVKE